MDRLETRVAFVTGGASGIGLGIAEALLDAGASVVLADINADAARSAAAAFGDKDRAIAVHLDVADFASWQRARDTAIARFGKVHVLCNNAGVTGSMRTPLEGLSAEAWEWTRSINLDGVMNGIMTFLPHIKGHREGGHIVNTGSMASLIAMAGTGDYTAAKFGVAGISEVLRLELQGSGVGVSILCPGHTRTGLIANSRLLMPTREADKQEQFLPGAAMTAAMQGGSDPRQVGRLVVEAIAEDRFYIFSHPEFAEQLDERAQRIASDLAWSRGKLA